MGILKDNNNYIPTEEIFNEEYEPNKLFNSPK